MKVVILAGGRGSRMEEATDLKPKPMIEIGNMPILWHIMKIYSVHKINEFIICGGYKVENIKEYFSKSEFSPMKIDVIDTGLDTLTGGRLKRIQNRINDTFCLTYGDGVSDVNISNLISFHKNHGKMVTISAVRPPARFGALKLKDSEVVSFKEKSQLTESWINGGFFVMEPDFFEMLSSDETVLEKEPLERAASMKELIALDRKSVV